MIQMIKDALAYIGSMVGIRDRRVAQAILVVVIIVIIALNEGKTFELSFP